MSHATATGITSALTETIQARCLTWTCPQRAWRYIIFSRYLQRACNMFFGGYPSLSFLILCVIIPPIVGLVIAESFRDWLAYLSMAVIDLSGLYAITVYIAMMYADYIKNMDEPQKNTEPAPRPVLQDVNTADLQYNQSTMRVRFDARKNFCNIVLARMEHGYAKVDLTEKYWLVRKPQKWQGTPEEFRAMMPEWDGDVFERKDGRKNSPYIIRNESRLRDKAQGIK